MQCALGKPNDGARGVLGQMKQRSAVEIGLVVTRCTSSANTNANGNVGRRNPTWQLTNQGLVVSEPSNACTSLSLRCPENLPFTRQARIGAFSLQKVTALSYRNTPQVITSLHLKSTDATGASRCKLCLLRAV